MSQLSTILLLTLAGSLISLTGGIILLFKKDLSGKLTDYLSAFAGGTLLGTAFLDLLPEAVESMPESRNIFLWTLVGILTFFLLERFVHWFHHHHEHDENQSADYKKPTGALIILGDSIHNFIDGVAIAGTFLVNPQLGLITTLAVGAHEIPQEIGDFGILLKAGYSKKKVLWYNVLSACTAFAGALITYFLGTQITALLPVLLAITAGFFIYIALSDLVPEIHAWGTKKLAIIESTLLIAGVVAVGVLVQVLE